MVNLDGLGSGPVVDADEAALLHRLCPECTRLVRWIDGHMQTDKHISKRIVFGKIQYGSLPIDPLPSAHTLKTLQESAESGCHMCSLFYTQRQISDEDDRLSQHLEYDLNPLGISLRSPRNYDYCCFLPFPNMESRGMGKLVYGF